MDYYKNFSLAPIKGEIWKDIIGYEGLYKISNMGRVFALNSSFYFPNGGLCKRESLIKKQSRDKDGTIIEYSSIRKAYLTENTTKHFMKKICATNGKYKGYKFAYE